VRSRDKQSVGVVIPAGGRGVRLGSDVPKQFLLLQGKPILQHSVEKFESLPAVSEIVVVVPADQLRRAEAIIEKARFRKVSHVVVGGSERQHSVRNGLLCFDREPQIALVHDAVRPLVAPETIGEVIRQTRRHGAAVVGVRVKDTTKVGEGGFYTKTLNRGTLWSVQTPQGFRFEILKRAHLAAQRSAFLGTDEASLVERLRIPVKIVEGEYRNFKITTKEDLMMAEAMLSLGL
jgi:2-C-methyl-D-erythritol 4-phosphate cytidylyltransferase